MEAKKKPEKIVVAYREKKKDHKKPLVSFFVIAIIVLTVLGIICFTKSNLIIPGVVCISMVVVFGLLIFIIIKKSQIIERVNKYPKIAMLIYGPYLCIVRDQIEKIKLTDIQKVSKANDMAQGLLVRVRKTSGSITIRANGKNYNVYQIVNVDASSEAIKQYVKLSKSKNYK